MVKHLITGGNGLLGKELQKYLKDFVAPNKKELNVTRKISVPEGVKYVFHLAAVLDEKDPNLYKVNVGGIENVLKACVDSEVKKIIYPSSIGVLGSGFLTPDSEYNPLTEYERTKMLAEQMIINYAEKYSMKYTIVRFPVIIGPNRYWKGIINAAMKLVPIIGNGKNHFPLSDWRDSARLLSLCTKRKFDNKIIHGVFHHKTYEEVYKEILNVLGIDRRPIKIPYWLGIMLAYLNSLRDSKGIFIPEHVKRLTADRVVAVNYREFGFMPEYELHESIRDVIKLLFPSVLSDKRNKHTRNV
jgi:nucleoside-diphosphate-sugar epimerase